MTYRSAGSRWAGIPIGVGFTAIGGLLVLNSAPLTAAIAFVVLGCVDVVISVRTRLVFTDDQVTIYPALGPKMRIPRGFCISGAAVLMTGAKSFVVRARFEVGIMTRARFVRWTIAATGWGADSIVADIDALLDAPRGDGGLKSATE
ncbi:hypothetical protein [Flexivirga caeni]|uniref:hypothetical protein n=1 Tax=Flexivirga caeni TaxID=2294115 RepID=UPI0011CEB3C3|nr:hypothetical protein [Flexivirga caeni]